MTDDEMRDALLDYCNSNVPCSQCKIRRELRFKEPCWVWRGSSDERVREVYAAVFENPEKPDLQSIAKSNADVIRAMSDEQLCDFLGLFENGQIHYGAMNCGDCIKSNGQRRPTCDECLMSWLQFENTEGKI